MTEKLEKEFCFNKEDFDTFGVRNFSVLKIFQEVATEHASLLGVGYDDLMKYNLLWVCIKIKFQILRQPKPNENLKIVTYPSEKNFAEYHRNYLIYDKSGNMVIKGMAKWCAISNETRRISCLKNFDMPAYDFGDEIFPEKPHRLKTFEPEFLPDYSYQVASSDIDRNGHMNNTMYAKIVDNMLAGKTQKVHDFEIDYLKETFESQRLDMYKLQENDGLKILGKICEDRPGFVVCVQFKN